MQRRSDSSQNSKTAVRYTHKTGRYRDKIELQLSRVNSRLPSIPDCRNKYGIDANQQSMGGYIHKSQEDLRRQKEIMKCYRSTLQPALPSLQSTKSHNHKKSHSPSSSQMLRMIKSLQLDMLCLKDKESKECTLNKRRVLKVRKAKLRSNQPLNNRQQSIEPYRLSQDSSAQQKKQQKAEKFQFFSSSEPRFKAEVQKQNKENCRKTVGEYMQMIKKGREIVKIGIAQINSSTD